MSIPKLRESFVFLFTKPGLTLVGINFLYMLIFGLLNLLAGVFIFGPATLILQGQHVFMWVILPFLSLIFLMLICAVTICVQFVIFYALYRHQKGLTPMISWDVVSAEVERFKIYFESVVRATLEVILGLLFLIVPGVILFFKYILIAPVSVFEYSGDLSAQDVLTKSIELTENKRLSIFYVLMGLFILYLLIYAIFGTFISRLMIGPFLMSFVSIYLFKEYQR